MFMYYVCTYVCVCLAIVIHIHTKVDIVVHDSNLGNRKKIGYYNYEVMK